MNELNDVKIHRGLKEIYLDRTKSSYIDGKNGKLYYRGFNINELANNSSFEEVSYLLIHGTYLGRHDQSSPFALVPSFVLRKMGLITYNELFEADFNLKIVSSFVLTFFQLIHLYVYRKYFF